MTRSLRQLIAATVLILFSTLPVRAAEVLGFDADALARAQAKGQAILVVFHADWSPTSLAQRQVIERLRQEAVFRNAVVFVADYEKSPVARQQLAVDRPATVLVYKGRKLVARTVDEAAEHTLRSLWAKGL